MFNKPVLKIYKASLAAFILKLFSIGGGYFLIYIITFFYGAEGLGFFSISRTILLIFVIVSVLGLDSASIRFISENSSIDRIRKIYLYILKLIIPFSIFISLLLFCSSSFLATTFNNHQLEQSFKLISFGILPLSLIYINSESLRGFEKIKLYSIFRFLLIPIIASLMVLLLYNLGFKNIYAPVISFIISIYLVFIISTVIWLTKINIFKKNINTKISFKYLLNISLPMLLTTSMFYIIQWTDIIILGYFESSSNNRHL